LKALVLGGTGFIGSWIARKLIPRGHRVTVFTRTSKQLISSVERSIEYVVGDLNDYDAVCGAMRGRDAVFDRFQGVWDRYGIVVSHSK
jgi:nucleoside-diphosphate-sugar epimerase